MPVAVRDGVLHAIAGATSDVFRWAGVIAVAVPILALFVREVALRGGTGEPAPERPTSSDELVAI